MDPTTLVYLLIFLVSIAVLYDQATKRVPTRLDPSQAPKSRFEIVPAGANGSPTPANGVDIIFVHGLGSNPDTTWRATKSVSAADVAEDAAPNSERFVNWVSDFLPDDILPAGNSDVRIFFYNYDSYWKRDAVHTRLTNLGNELLENINGKIRLSETERSRSLIFVAYSFGGLVIKRALVQAHSSRDFNHVAKNTKAILFLGTPHRGTSFGPWGWLAAKVLRPLGSNPCLLANLEYNSITLHDLHKDFIAVAPDDLRVFNFFEKRPMRILRLRFIQWQQFCVREQSATYEGRNVRNIGLSVDHYGLNKFGSRSESYQTILSKLTEVTRSSARPVKRHYAVPLETVHTYTERAELSAELEKKLRTRHEKASVPYAVALHGLGGAGKSQLALAYAEKYKDRYNPILWIDATDEEAVRSSFRRCAVELGLPKERAETQGSILTDGAVQAVLRWLRDRTEADDEWLMVVDNLDDISWGIQNIMPKGSRGSVIVTSRYDRRVRLAPWAYELVPVGVMSQEEGVALLLQHLRLSRESASEEVRHDCDKVAERLGYLALAIDLAGAYIGSDSGSELSAPERVLSVYLADYDRHRDELLRMVGFQDLLATQKTVWTVWNTTLEKITREHPDLQPELLLTFLAQFKGSIIEDELFRLACLGMAKVDAKLVGDVEKAMPAGLLQFLSLKKDEWDSFRYRKSRDVLVRYSLIQRVEGQWPGLKMHSLVQWRALQKRPDRPWRWWYMKFILAACCQMLEQDQPEFRRHLVGHLPDISENHAEDNGFAGTTLGRVYYDEGWWAEAESLFVQVMETRKRVLGEEHPSTLTSMANLASTFWKQGRWAEAESLFVQVMETRKRVLGEEHPSTLTSMANLASTFWKQGRWKEAESLDVQVMETSSKVLKEEHPDTLTSMANLSSTYRNQGRWKKAESLDVQVMETSSRVLGDEHPDTLTSMANLASTYRNQGRWKEAESLEVQVMETRKRMLGEEHPDTLTSMANLASTYRNQGRWKEAESLDVQVMETRSRVLGEEHPDTLTSMNNLAFTWEYQGRHSDALALMRDCAEARQRVLGEEHPCTLSSLGAVAAWSS